MTNTNQLISFMAFVAFSIALLAGFWTTGWTLEAMNEDEMEDVTAQEGIVLDINLTSSFEIGEAQYVDSDGADGDQGIVGIHGISPESSMDISGITIDADGAQTVGGVSQGAIVIGVPDISSGLKVDVVPGGDDTAFSSSINNGSSMGTFGIGDITSSGTTIEVASQ